MKKYEILGNNDTRSGFGDALAILGNENPNVVALCADLTGSLKMDKFAAEHPDRFFQVGIAEANMIGIAAGMLDGMSLGALKGALMARGAREVARLIRAMGGSELSAYGLCHLGDYEATVFSPYSHNRRFGEALIRGERYDALAEGYYTAAALIRLSDTYQVDLPISRAVYEILYEQKDPKETLNALFSRSLKQEFWVE